jgi:hypothetical protein
VCLEDARLALVVSELWCAEILTLIIRKLQPRHHFADLLKCHVAFHSGTKLRWAVGWGMSQWDGGDDLACGCVVVCGGGEW